MKAITTILIIALLSICIIPPSHAEDAAVEIANGSIDPQYLMNHDFENYNVGENPAYIQPIIMKYGRPDNHNHTLSVVEDNGSKVLQFRKYANSILPPDYIMSLPTLYKEYSMTFDAWISGTSRAQFGGGSIAFEGGSEESVAIDTIARILLTTYVNNASYVICIQGTSVGGNSYVNIAKETWYSLNITFFDNYSFSLGVWDRNTGSLISSAYYPNFLYNSPSGAQGRYATYIKLSMAATEASSTIKLDNLRIQIPSKVVNAYHYLNRDKAFTFIFDDGKIGVYDVAYPILKEHGLTAVIGVITSKVGTPGYMSWDQLEELSAAGWELASHSVNHIYLTEATIDQKRYEIDKSKIYIEENTSAVVTTFIAPYNAYSMSVDPIARINYTETPFTYRRTFMPTDGEFGNYYNLSSVIIGNHLIAWGHNVTAGTPVSDDITDYVLQKIVNDSLSRDYQWTTIQEKNEYTYHRDNFDLDTLLYLEDKYLQFEMDSAIPLTLQVTHPIIRFDCVVLVDNKIVATEIVDGALIVTAEPGEIVKIMTLAGYRQMKMDQAISPIIAIIPLVIVLSLIPMIMNLGRKLK